MSLREWLPTLLRRLRHLLRRNVADREMDEEMRLHLELEIEERVRRGMSRAEARRTARLDFGGLERFKEEARSARGVRPIEDLVQDAQYAVRVLRKSPGFTIASVLTLAIGISAVTAVFTVIDALLLRPPPVADPARLFVLAEVWTSGERSVSTDMGQHMYPFSHYLDVRQATSSVFSGLAAYRYGNVSLRLGTDTRALSGMSTSANYFHVLGVRAAIGRFHADTAERFVNAEPEAVIGYDLWQSQFLGDSGVIGRSMVVDSRPLTIVGVAPRGFSGTMTGLVADLWIPAALDARSGVALKPGEDIRRRVGPVTMVGRLRPGLTRAQATAALSEIGRRVSPEAKWQQVSRMTLDPVTGPPAMTRGAVLGFMGMLVLTAGFVLMIAAANIAGMLLARAAHRRREIAVRLALGAGRGRLVRQLVTESVLLCVVGGALGAALAWWLVGLVPAVQPPIGVRTALDLRVNGLVLSLAFGVSLAAGVLAGLTPALQSTQPGLAPGLRGIDGGQPLRSGRLRSAFVVAQLAMSLVLLATAGLFARATQRALLVDPGLDAAGVAVAEVDLGAHGYDRARGEAFYAQLSQRLAARPEIVAASLGQWTPLSLSHNGEGVSLPDGSRVGVTWGVVDAQYLETMRIPLVAGRSFNQSESASSAPTVIVNETLARRLWPGRSALGQQVKISGMREVVGVVRDGKYRNLGEGATAYAFLPFAQRYSSRMMIHARARGDVPAALAAIREEVRALDPNLALEKSGALARQLSIYTLPQQAAAWCIGTFGLVGLGLAALGVYGVIAYHVARRTREFGIRMALGARGSDVVLEVVRRGFRVTGIAVAIGIPMSIGIARLASQFLFGVGAADPFAFVAVPAFLVSVALVASWLPARRAARVDPMISLRAE